MLRHSLACFGLAVLATSALAFPPPPKSNTEEDTKFPPPPEATGTHWRKSQNNLKQIGLAFHSYHDTYGHFPSDEVDANGKLLLSWRVKLLPFLEEDVLYKQFKMDEAWDGPTNKALLEKMPKVFAPVRVQAKAGRTFYQGFSGAGTIFDPENRKLTFAGITDGTSNTVMVLEAGEAVEWSKPIDLKFDKDKELPKLGGHFDGDFNMAVCDGSVRRVKKVFDATVMKALITRAGGEVVSFDDLNK